ncbi:MAG: DUF4139 domain-containing protein [Actinomycetota bacterium]
MKLRWIGLGALVLAGQAMAAEVVKEVVSGGAEREATAITVYNEDLALVKERRKVTLPAGLSRLSLREVSGQMRPETALLKAVSGHPVTLVEQNFDFDLLTPGKLLEKYVGREVTVIRSHPTTGDETREKATVLSANNGTVLRFADRIETGAPGRIVFDTVPANLRDRPTLSVLLEAAGGPQSLELSYLTGGLAWKADYVANLSPDNRQMDLSGWVTLTNRSGAGYDNANLQLVAGTVNRVRQSSADYMAIEMRAAPSPRRMEVAQEALMDYHLYTFDRPTSIADNQTKQLALLSASAIPVRKSYLLAGGEWYYRDRYGQVGQKLKPAVFVEFDNKGGQLGKPLPAGVVRVYAKDSKGAAQFVGEDRIEHTAKNEKVKLKLGEAFDVTAERKQTAFKRVADNVSESSHRIDLRNAKDEPVTVRIQETLPGDWEMVSESRKHSKESARIAAWDVDVPANGAAVLEYTVRTKW